MTRKTHREHEGDGRADGEGRDVASCIILCSKAMSLKKM